MAETKPVGHRRRMALLGVAAGSVAVGVAFPAALAWSFLHPPRHRHHGTPKSLLGLDYARVRFTSSDGVVLRGWWVPAPSALTTQGVVVICHGYHGNRGKMLPYLDILHRAGYAALLFDFRAHGWSGGHRATFGVSEVDDLRAAVQFASERADAAGLPLAVLGESMGAAVALLGTAQEPRVQAVIADSPYARFDQAVASRLRLIFGPAIGPRITPRTQALGERFLGVACHTIAPVEVVAQIAPRPVLLIQGLADRLVEPENARQIALAAEKFGNVTLWEVPDARHVKSVHVARELYIEKVTQFLRDSLSAPLSQSSASNSSSDVAA